MNVGKGLAARFPSENRALTSVVVRGSLWGMGRLQDRRTVALATPVVERARELSALTSRHGWASLGIDRDDPATMSAIFEEGLKLLAARLKAKGKK